MGGPRGTCATGVHLFRPEFFVKKIMIVDIPLGNLRRLLLGTAWGIAPSRAISPPVCVVHPPFPTESIGFAFIIRMLRALQSASYTLVCTFLLHLFKPWKRPTLTGGRVQLVCVIRITK